MTKPFAWVAPVAVISVATLAALALDGQVSTISPARAGDAEAQCPRGNATLHGAYMSMGGGTIVGVGPVAFIGTGYFDGKGGIINPFTISTPAGISRANVTGTYTVNSDCSGTNSLANGANNFDIRVSPDGSKVDYIETDAGTVVSGSATRVKD
jgi:hypothetical protein